MPSKAPTTSETSLARARDFRKARTNGEELEDQKAVRLTRGRGPRSSILPLSLLGDAFLVNRQSAVRMSAKGLTKKPSTNGTTLFWKVKMYSWQMQLTTSRANIYFSLRINLIASTGIVLILCEHMLATSAIIECRGGHILLDAGFSQQQLLWPVDGRKKKTYGVRSRPIHGVYILQLTYFT